MLWDAYLELLEEEKWRTKTPEMHYFAQIAYEVWRKGGDAGDTTSSRFLLDFVLPGDKPASLVPAANADFTAMFNSIELDDDKVAGDRAAARWAAGIGTTLKQAQANGQRN